MNSLYFLVQALYKLRPNSLWTINGEDYSGLIWKDENQTKPTEEEVTLKINELQKEWEDTQYQRDRAPQYPSLADFADAYYWAQRGDNTKMNAYIAQCDEVKNQYPKP